MEIYARAKINLGLDVLGLRPDGYHDIRTVMQTIDLYDILHITACNPSSVSEGSGPAVFLTTDSCEITADHSNLVYKAAALLLEEFRPDEGLRIHLEKRIPAGAGMAGGSTDAASTLAGVNAVLSLGLSMEQLRHRAVKLGADVPFCLLGGTALAEGIGEILTPLPPLPPCSLLLAKPPVSISTKEAYDGLDQSRPAVRPDIDRTISALYKGDLEALALSLSNVFEPGACLRHPEILRLRTLMTKSGAIAACMSGSGPTVYGIFENEEKAAKACKTVLTEAPDAFVLVTKPYLPVAFPCS